MSMLYMIFLQNLLYQHLMVFRNDLAREVQLAPFLVCSNGQLADLARARYLCVYRGEGVLVGDWRKRE